MQLTKRLLIEASIILVSLFFVVYSSYFWWKTENRIIEETVNSIDYEATVAAKDINERLLYVMRAGQDFADGLTNGTIPYSEVEKRAKETFVKHRKDDAFAKLNTFSVAFSKEVDQSNQLINWYNFANESNGEIRETKRNYDYTDSNSSKAAWFIQTVNQKKPLWHSPKFSDTTQNFIVPYTIPFFNNPNKEAVAGVISCAFSIQEITEMLYRQDYRKSGFSIITSKDDHLIFHPNQLLPLLEASNHKEHNNNDMDDLLGMIRNQKKDIVSYDTAKYGKVWVIYKTIPASNWNYYIVFLEAELNIQEKTLPAKILLTVSGIILITTCAFVIFVSRREDEQDLWVFSIIFSLICSVGIAGLWHSLLVKKVELPNDMKRISSIHEINDYIKNKNEFSSFIHSNKRSYYIPTGVFINSVRFEDSNDVKTSGFIWQKYELDNQYPINKIPDDFCDLRTDNLPKDKGIFLIESFEDVDKTYLDCSNASYKAIHNRTVTIGWYFNSELRQPFDYSNYPLDKNLIWVRMRPSIYHDNVMFIPDFNSYHKIYETALMGVDAKNFILPNWDLLGTFFSTQTIEPNGNLGLYRDRGYIMDELLFNVDIGRAFLDTFFSTIFPIFIVYLILFVILFSSLEDLLTVLGINAGLLFSVALWHSGLRASLSSTGISYFETFYFVCYFVISLVSVNSVLLACNYSLRLLHYKNNLFSKLAFWPLVFGTTFLITLLMLF